MASGREIPLDRKLWVYNKCKELFEKFPDMTKRVVYQRVGVTERQYHKIKAFVENRNG